MSNETITVKYSMGAEPMGERQVSFDKACQIATNLNYMRGEFSHPDAYVDFMA